jgi:hypothetical protein
MKKFDLGCKGRYRLLITAVCLGLALPGVFISLPVVKAADHYNLEEGIPVTIEDALPTPYRNREFQILLDWERTEEGENRYLGEARLDVGLLPNLEVEVAVPFIWGNAVEDDGLDDVRLAALYNFNQETLRVPALALVGEIEFPTGEESEGLDTTLKFIATKTVGRSSLLHRVHLNLAWKRNSQPLPDERENYYMAAIGYDRRIGATGMLIFDFVREQEKEKGKDANLFEVGYRYQLTPLMVFAIGAGVGIGDESPDFRIAVGFQRSLTLFPF